jgi:hypothetical protein
MKTTAPVDAIQPDANATAAAAPGQDQRPLSPREAMLEQIEANRAQVIAEETGTELPAGDAAPAQGAGQAEGQEHTDATAATGRRVLDSPADTFVRVKVEGEEREVPLTDVLRTYQVTTAADKRMQDATRIRQEAEALLQQARQQAQPQAEAEPQSPADAQGQRGAAESPADLFMKAMDAWADDDPDGARQLLAPVFSGRQQPTQPTPADPAQLAQAVKTQLAVEAAFEQYQTNYSHIANNPFLDEMTGRFLDEGLDAGQPFGEALTAAAERTKAWVIEQAGTLGGTTTAPAPTAREQRQHNKAGLRELPGAQARAPTHIPAPESPSDIVAEMRKSRGLD